MELRNERTIELCWLAFFTRVMAGLLFAMAGYHKVFVLTPRSHAQKLFLEPYAGTWMPGALLWLLGVTIPFVELLGGTLLIVGWLRRPVAVALGFLLLLVTYGHALTEPFFDVTTHIFPRLLLLLPALMLHTSHDLWSVDAWLARRNSRRTQ